MFAFLGDFFLKIKFFKLPPIGLGVVVKGKQFEHTHILIVFDLFFAVCLYMKSLADVLLKITLLVW